MTHRLSSWTTAILPLLVLLLLPGCSGMGLRGFGPLSGGENAKSASSGKASAKSSKKTAKSNQEFNVKFSNARTLEADGKIEESRAVYEKLIAEYPDRPQPYHRLAVVADRQRRHREAQRLYGEALRLKPLDSELLGDLGYCYFLQGKLTKAESALLKASTITPSEDRHRNNLGLVYGHLGKNDLALESFRHGGSEADAQYNLAFILASTGKTEEAKVCFQDALIADPEHEKARESLASFNRYESTPPALRDQIVTSGDGQTWEAYIEPGSASGEGVIQASATSDSGNTQSLQNRARSLMQSRLGSKTRG